MADALDTLARLRNIEADEAKRTLGDAVGRESRARQTADDAHAARSAEAALAGSDAAHPLAGAYAAWLPASVQAIAAAEAACGHHAAATDAARQALASHKAALEAVETLLTQRDVVRRRDQARRAQLRLDELGHRLG